MAETRGMHYAEVAVNIDAPLEGTFHYHIPAELAGTVATGQLVEVEFGKRTVHDVVSGARDKIMGPDGLWPLDSPEAKALPALGRIYHIGLDGQLLEQPPVAV